MNQNDIQNAPKFAMRNHKAIQESAIAGCYQCVETISTNDITDWTDWGATAICPKCGCDCLIAQSFGIDLNHSNLQQIKTYWFGK